MKHGRWRYSQGCRCDICVVTERTYKREWLLRTGRLVPGRRGIKYSRCGVRVETVLPELEQLLRTYGTQRRVAQLLGLSESAVYRMLARKRQPHMTSRWNKRVHLGTAQRIMEAARGGRALAEEHHQAALMQAKNERRAAVKRERRRMAKVEA